MTRMLNMKSLLASIDSREAKVGILGLGHLGMPLALTFAKSFPVIAYDINEQVIDAVSKGCSGVPDVTDEELRQHLNNTFFPTSQHQRLAECAILIICMPTPLIDRNEPDLTHVRAACETISQILKKGQFVILESTTYPGTTEEVVIPILERTGLRAGVDFGVAYSPNRINPGDSKHTISNTPKIVGGINQECTDIAARLYSSVIETVVRVRDCKTAEAAKMLENIFRNVNIALINELALVFPKMGINIWDVIEVAATKPYGFMPFYPGPGTGGHCIPLDPYYLAYKAKKYGFLPRFIELSGETNEFMKVHTVNLAEIGLEKIGKKLHDSQIAVLGLAYKKEVGDTRESPAKKIIEEIVNLGGKVKVYDPYAKSIETRLGLFYSEESLEIAMSGADCAIFVVDHNRFRNLNWGMLKELMNQPVVIDCRNIFDESTMKDFVYLGIGKPET